MEGERKNVYTEIRVKYGSYLRGMWYVMYKTREQKQTIPYEGLVLHSASLPDIQEGGK